MHTDIPEQQTPARRKEVRQKRRFPILAVVVVILVIGLAGAATYFYLQYNHLKNNPELVAKQETDDLIQRVGKLITLPTGETPTVATVDDKTKLADQAFFADVENGDKLLIYTKAQKAIIYRESTNKIINVGPVSIDSAQEGTNTQAE